MRELFLPSIANEQPVSGQAGQWGMNDGAWHFAQVWLDLLGERAHIMRVDQRLVACAAAHAEYLDSRTPEEIASLSHIEHLMHYNHHTGKRSNQRVLDAGYRLPDFWDKDKNYVESCARNNKEPAEVAVSLAYHDTHHDHMFGVGWYAGHTVYGVGNCNADWVFLACPPES